MHEINEENWIYNSVHLFTGDTDIKIYWYIKIQVKKFKLDKGTFREI